MPKTLIIFITITLFTLDLFSIEEASYTKVDAEQLYKKCAGCHGAHGEKSALGKSKVINEMRQETLVLSIRGYQNGTYGGAMKALMKGQVFRLKPYEIEALSSYIAAMNTQKEPAHLQSNTNTAQKQCVTTMPVPRVSSSAKNLPLSMKIKSKRYSDGVVRMKAMIRHKMMTVETARIRRATPGHVNLIRIQEDEHILVEIKSTAYLSTNPLLKMRYKSFGGKSVSIYAEDTSSKKNEKIVSIKEAPSSSINAPLQIEVKNMISNKKGRGSISEYFSNAPLYESNKIMIKAPDIASNGNSVPLGIRTTLHAKSITIFASQEKDHIEMVAQWILHGTELIDLEMKAKLKSLSYSPDDTRWATGVISVVVEGVDGKYYIGERMVSISLGGGDP